MGVLVKLDEDLSPLCAAPFELRGHNARTVAEQGWGGTKDPALLPLVVAANEFLVTADKGFGDIRRYPPGTHRGILLLRADEDRVKEYLVLIESVLAAWRLEDLIGATVVASPRGIRVRRAV